MKNPYWLALFLIYVVVRILVSVCYWPSHPEHCELAIGTIGKELIKGPILPVGEYQMMPGEGGSVLCGLLAGTIGWLIGYSYASIRLAALTCASLAMLLWYRLVARALGERAALWYLAVGILLPPNLLYWSTWLNGNWSFTDIFHALDLILICHIVDVNVRHISFPPDKWTGELCLFSLGLLLGLGVYISNYLFIMLFYGFFVLLIFNVMASFRKVIMVLMGLFIGIIPCALYNLQHGLEGLQKFSFAIPGSKTFFYKSDSLRDWVAQTTINLFRQFKEMIIYWLPDSWFGNLIAVSHIKEFLGYAYEALVILGIMMAIITVFKDSGRSGIRSFHERSRRNGCIILGFFGLAIFLTCLSRLGIVRSDYYPYRYLLPLLPGTVLLIAISFDRLTLSAWRSIRFIGWGLVLIFYCVSTIGAKSLLCKWEPDVLFKRHGYDYVFLGGYLAMRFYYIGEQDRAIVLAEKVRDPQDREDLIGSITDRYWFIPFAERWSPVWILMGGKQFEAKDIELFQRLTKDKIQQCYYPLMYRALGRGLAWSHGSDFRVIASLLYTLDTEAASWAWQGVGSIDAWRYGKDAKWLLGALSEIPSKDKRSFCQGVGAAWGYGIREECYDFDRLSRSLPEETQNYIISGINIGFQRNPFSRLEL